LKVIELVYLFLGLCIVAVVPGPLAVIAFQGGAENARSFLIGLAGQLLGLILMTSALIYFGTRIETLHGKWLFPAASCMMMILGIKAIVSRGVSRPPEGLTFVSTFIMAFSNPKAIFGFGPQLILFSSNEHLDNPVFLANLVLVLAVSLTMTFYFSLGRFWRCRVVVERIRIVSGAVLIAFSIVLAVRPFLF
jgi:threonine/homoserine/homoserine lactone efflux protein